VKPLAATLATLGGCARLRASGLCPSVPARPCAPPALPARVASPPLGRRLPSRCVALAGWIVSPRPPPAPPILALARAAEHQIQSCRGGARLLGRAVTHQGNLARAPERLFAGNLQPSLRETRNQSRRKSPNKPTGNPQPTDRLPCSSASAGRLSAGTEGQAPAKLPPASDRRQSPCAATPGACPAVAPRRRPLSPHHPLARRHTQREYSHCPAWRVGRGRIEKCRPRPPRRASPGRGFGGAGFVSWGCFSCLALVVARFAFVAVCPARPAVAPARVACARLRCALGPLAARGPARCAARRRGLWWPGAGRVPRWPPLLRWRASWCRGPLPASPRPGWRVCGSRVGLALCPCRRRGAGVARLGAAPLGPLARGAGLRWLPRPELAVSS
jgi:hypothetical protein